jgi:hypothetical protein
VEGEGDLKVNGLPISSLSASLSLCLRVFQSVDQFSSKMGASKESKMNFILQHLVFLPAIGIKYSLIVLFFQAHIALTGFYAHWFLDPIFLLPYGGVPARYASFFCSDR